MFKALFLSFITSILGGFADAPRTLIQELTAQAQAEPRYHLDTRFRSESAQGKIHSIQMRQVYELKDAKPSTIIEFDYVTPQNGGNKKKLVISVLTRFLLEHGREGDHRGELLSEIEIVGDSADKILDSGFHYSSNENHRFPPFEEIYFHGNTIHQGRETMLKEPRDVETSASFDSKSGNLLLVQIRKEGGEMVTTSLTILLSANRTKVEKVKVVRYFQKMNAAGQLQKSTFGEWNYTVNGPFEGRK